MASSSTTSTKPTPSLSLPFSDSFMSPNLAACVTLYTRYQPEGCGTISRNRQTGFIIEYDESNWQIPHDGLFVVLLPESMLNKTSVENILGQNRKGQVQGILVTNETLSSDIIQNNPSVSRPRGSRTASQALTYGNSYDWNPSGDGLEKLDFQGIPMVYLRDSAVGDYLQKEVKKSDIHHFIKASFNYYMGPVDSDMNSNKCLQWHDISSNEWRPKCQPLGGNSVWSKVNYSKRRRLEDTSNEDKPMLLISSNLDGSSLFHDLTFAANQAASNILTMILTAKLLGQVSDLSSTNKEIILTLFQGESYGYLGSRRFLLDIMGFECESDPVSSVNKNKNDNNNMACLYPLRPSLEFTNLNGQNIAGMLAVDQVGILSEEKNFYFHADYDTKLGQTLSKILSALSDENSFSISEVAVEGNDDTFEDGATTIPPTPLTSLLSISDGQIGGAVLSGYGEGFVSTYGSRHDTPDQLDYDAIAAAATIIARAALAAAIYDDDDDDSNADEAVEYALKQIPNALTASDETLIEVGHCLTSNAACDLLKKYASMDASMEKERTGIDTRIGVPLGRSDRNELERAEPNYYVSVFSLSSGQPFVSIGNTLYGAYKPENENSKQYGQHITDAFSLQPTLLEQAVRGLFNDFLGRPPNSNNLLSCESTQQCKEVDYCSDPADAICTGGKICVCGPQAHYHIALDEAIEATKNKIPGFFTNTGKSDKSALYTEPNWDSGVGVQIFIDDGSSLIGWVTLSLGLVVLYSSTLIGKRFKKFLIKEKLF